MRPGMIILLVFGILDIIGPIFNLISYATLAGDSYYYSGLYWGQFGGTFPLLIFSILQVMLISRWLQS